MSDVSRKRCFEVVVTSKRKPVSSSKKNAVLEANDYRCIYCGERAGTVDHIIPYSWSGDNSYRNLVACCQRCNSVASDKVFDSLGDKLSYVRERVGIVFSDNVYLESSWVTCQECHGKFMFGRGRGEVVRNDLILCPDCAG